MKTFGIIIIGDEILSGKRQDKHLSKSIETLNARGLSLSYAHYLGDEPVQIVDTLKRSFATFHIVFSFGGIGATPDDYTRQCAADALGVALHVHPDAMAAMKAKPGFELTPNRVKMAEFPIGSSVIPNPYNQIAAFSCNDHHFLPGFPEMAWPMMEWVLETKYHHLFNQVAFAEETIIIHEAGGERSDRRDESYRQRLSEHKTFKPAAAFTDGEDYRVVNSRRPGRGAGGDASDATRS